MERKATCCARRKNELINELIYCSLAVSSFGRRELSGSSLAERPAGGEAPVPSAALFEALGLFACESGLTGETEQSAEQQPVESV